MKYKTLFITAFLLLISIFSLGQFTYATGEDSAQNNKTTDTSTESNQPMGIKTDCLNPNSPNKGKCGINIYKVLNIKKSNQNVTVERFVQDIVLSSTMFFGTIFSIVILFSGFLYILSAIQGSDGLQSKAKKGLSGGIIGLVLVTGAFGIVRFVQFLASGGG